jgi:hypothetical protein
MDGDYDCDSLGGLLAVLTANAVNIQVGMCVCVCACVCWGVYPMIAQPMPGR